MTNWALINIYLITSVNFFEGFDDIHIVINELSGTLGNKNTDEEAGH